MVQGRSVEGPSSGNSVGEITGGVLEVNWGASFGGFVLRGKGYCVGNIGFFWYVLQCVEKGGRAAWW